VSTSEIFYSIIES